ncbi:bifunctional serine/threonine-protein kinase/ABC transporter substrate-binding protein [Streptomyces sp. NPDC000888]
MHALKAGDPLSVGGHRLLGRLGAGGMGVVYLARSTGGALVALKVIRAEYAADHDFRTRFRREAEAAGGLTGQWLVPVTAADPGAREPWLATAFVSGPSLAEAVALHGPLPYGTVCALGIRLAEALTEVHATGLVHRDVKPGNVLLALDGPRLIDFGIARSTGATALTASDVVIGSPGYLSPEQAQARAGDIGPSSDVFSLGCVLAYAATGRRPFGTGTSAAVIFRTVHEEPDLDAVPFALVPLLTDCLAKDPGARPTAQEVRDALAREGEPESDWLPPELPRLIAERSAAVLALPDPDPVTLMLPPERPALSRRRLLTLGSAAGVVVAGGGLAAWAAAGRPTDSDGGTTGGPLPRYAIGLHADLSGTGKAVGRAQERGARLAVADFNSHAGRTFDLTLKVLDDGGKAKRAAEVAGKFVADDDVYAVIGPTGDASSGAAVVARYKDALLPIVNVSSGTAEYTAMVDRVFFQLRPDESTLSTAFLDYLTYTEKSVRTAVIDDRAAGGFSWEVVKDLSEWPPANGTTTSHVVPAASEDFGPAAAAVLAAEAQAVVYAGNSPHRAALCARALEQAGFRGTRMATEPVLETEFLTEAGTAAEGWLISATYVDPAGLPAAAGFVAAYKKRFGVRAVEPFAVEAYDALLFVAQGLRELGTAAVERGAMVRRLRAATYKGLAKTIEFEAASAELHWVNGLFLYRVQNGAPRFLGRYDQVKKT